MIRAFTKEDVPAVARLFQRVFRHSEDPPPRSLERYFVELYFDNPWYDGEVTSLVYETQGQPMGFVGVLPFRFRLKQTRLRGAIAGNFMVAPELRDPLGSLNLLKRVFTGPQDILVSDTASPLARRIWEGLGGASVPSHGVHWLRVLRPAQFGAAMLKKLVAPPVALDRLARPFGRLVDALAAQLPQSPFRAPATKLHQGPLDETGLLASIDAFSAKSALRPEYTPESLGWLIAMAKRNHESGPLRMRAVYDESGRLVGWFVYYPNPGKRGHVLQLVARPGALDDVLDHLFADAFAQGTAFLDGRAEPRLIQRLSGRLCILRYRGDLVAHARRPEVLHALHSGDAFFTQLEGESWTRFQGDSFVD
jgi:Acetyltransferase (GNAT) domain